MSDASTIPLRTELRLDIYGIAIRLTSDPGATEVLDRLRRDFAYFVAKGAPPPEFAIGWSLESKPAPRGGADRCALFGMRDFKVYDSGSTRFVRYADGAMAVYDFGRRRGRIYCPQPERLHELAYLAVLSRAGEELDRRGMHRVHALGFELGGQGGLLLLPSGGGKSVLALELLRSSTVGILSDDTPLVRAGARLDAFPLRWGFRPETDLAGVPEGLVRPFPRRNYGFKRLVDVGFFEKRIKTDLPLRWLLIGRRALSGEPRIEGVWRGSALAALAVNLVVGHGVAQMAEYMLRPDLAGLLAVARIAVSRVRTGLRLLKEARTYRFTLGPDPKASARALAAFLEASPR